MTSRGRRSEEPAGTAARRGDAGNRPVALLGSPTFTDRRYMRLLFKRGMPSETFVRATRGLAAAFIASTLAACSSSLSSPSQRALPAAADAPGPQSTQDPARLTLAFGNCVAPATCDAKAGDKYYIVFHGPQSVNPTVTVTPSEVGNPYGFAITFCAQKMEPIDGISQPVGDQLGVCRNIGSFIEANDNAVPTNVSLIFFGDQSAPPDPNNIFNSANFYVSTNGVDGGIPLDGTYGFAINLHVHDYAGHFAILYLQWCPTAMCKSL